MKTLTKPNYKQFIEEAQKKNSASGKLICTEVGLTIIPTEIGDEYNPRVKLTVNELLSLVVEAFKVNGRTDEQIKQEIKNILNILL